MLSSHRRLTTIGIFFGLFLSALELTVVGTAAPLIIRDLGGFESYPWIFSIYLLSSTLSMPFWGRASDHWGRKKLFLASMMIFLVGSLLCGISNSITQLILSRALKGIGGGGLAPLAFTIIADVYDINTRAKVQGYLSGVWGVASIISPFIAGVITDFLGWRWIFFINIFPGIIAIVLIAIFFHENNFIKRNFKLPAISLLSSIVCVTTLLLLFKSAQTSSTPQILWYTFLVFLSLAVFILSERYAKTTLIPRELFQYRIFNITCLNGFLCSAFILGLANYIPLLFQTTQGLSATESGMVLVPFTLSWCFMSIVSTRVMMHFNYKSLVNAGLLLTCLGLTLFVIRFENLAFFTSTFIMIVMGAGMAFNYPILMIATQYNVPKQLMGFATSSVFLIRNLGGTLGIALMGICLTHSFREKITHLSAEASNVPVVIELTQSTDALLSERVMAQIQSNPEILATLHSSMTIVYKIMLVCMLLAWLTVFALPKKSVLIKDAHQ